MANSEALTGLSALMRAVYLNDGESVRLLLAQKPDINVFEAAAIGLTDTLADMLSRDRAAAHAWSTDGFTPLHLAAHFNRAEAASALVRAGADLTAVSRNSLTVMPLHSAVAGRALEAARVLLEEGAPPNARQGGGWVPVMSAAQHGDAALVELLVRFGADLRVRNERGKSPADVATEAGHHDLAAWIESRYGARE
jgi:ankyrin repeat protein